MDTVDGSALLFVLDSVASIHLRVPHLPIVPQASFTYPPVLLSSTGQPLAATYRHLRWASSHPSVFTVDPYGKVIALRSGTAGLILTATDENVADTVPVTISTLTYRTVQYSGGWTSSFGCGLTITGHLYCWGGGFPDQLYGSDQASGGNSFPVPTELVTGVLFDSLSLGAGHGCALAHGGAAFCWGDNTTGALGNGSTVTSWNPVPVSGGITFSAIAAGEGNTCGLTQSGSAYCWGFGENGDFGNGGTTGSTVPVLGVSDISLRTISLSPGQVSWSGAHCGMTALGEAMCWGRNELGQVGNGTRSPSVQPPTPVVSPPSLVSVGAGGEHACGLTADGIALCWGNGEFGELARPLQYPLIDSVPGPIQAELNFVRLESGLYRSCGITDSGTVWCWGDGWGNTPGRVILPEPAVDLRVALAASCAISVTQVAYCWSGSSARPWRERGQ